jgi:hypothetical protein
MEIYPSTTGNDPIIEDLDHPRAASSETATLNPLVTDRPYRDDFPRERIPAKIEPLGQKRVPRKLARRTTKVISEEERRRQKELDAGVRM